jgi:peptidoglycan/xylan/chitin deacetylase (PgdA/CDA1 family)
VPRLSLVTTSWDDGDPLDLKVAELLRARALAGTFYIPLTGPDGRKTLDPEHLRSLASEGFEIGGHTTSHSVLTHLGPEEVAREVRVCKSQLEDIIGERVRMFCYPKGRFNADVIRQVKEGGYEGARTTRMFRQELDFDPFQMPTSLLAYPNKWKLYAKNLMKGRNLGGLFTYTTRFMYSANWTTIGKALFDRVLNEGGVWHLYGHSCRIEQLGLWDELRQMLDYVSNRDGVIYVTNRGVLNFRPAQGAPLLANHLSSVRGVNEERDHI